MQNSNALLSSPAAVGSKTHPKTKFIMALLGGLFIIPPWYFLVNPFPLEVIIGWESLAVILSGIFIFVYILWENKGDVPYKLPYFKIGIVNFIVFFVVSVLVMIFQNAEKEITGNQLPAWIAHLTSLVAMGIITHTAKKIIKRF